MIPARLAGYTLAVKRQGTRTNDAGDAGTPDGVWTATGVTARCVAYEAGGTFGTAGGLDSTPQRAREASSWVVHVNLDVDVVTGDRVVVTPDCGAAHTLKVMGARDYPVPAAVAHRELVCEEVVG